MTFSTRPRAPQDRSARWESPPASLSPGAAVSVFMVLLRAAHARARGVLLGRSDAATSPPPRPGGPDLTELVYELLDAHSDTTELAADLDRDLDEQWCAHLEYLQALQRHGRALLARVGTDQAA